MHSHASGLIFDGDGAGRIGETDAAPKVIHTVPHGHHLFFDARLIEHLVLPSNPDRLLCALGLTRHEVGLPGAETPNGSTLVSEALTCLSDELQRSPKKSTQAKILQLKVKQLEALLLVTGDAQDPRLLGGGGGGRDSESVCTNARRETPLPPLLRRPAGVRVLVQQICQGMDAHRDVGDGVNAAASVRATVLPNGNRLSEICYLNHGPDEFAATLLRDSSIAMRLQSEATEARTHLCGVLKLAIVNKRSFYYVECMAKGLLPQQHCQVLDPGSLCPIGSAFGVGGGEHPRPGCRDGGAGAEAPKLINLCTCS